MTHDKHHAHHPQQRKRPIHTDWRAWVVVGLMLLAMLAYVFSLDEALRPSGQRPAVPALDAVE